MKKPFRAFLVWLMMQLMKGKVAYLFVGHGASLTAAIQSLSGKGLSELRSMGGLTNNSLSILETKEDETKSGYTLKLWNDDSFLQ